MFNKITKKNILIAIIRFTRSLFKACLNKYMKLNNISEDSFLDYRDFQYALEQLESIDLNNKEEVEKSILSLSTVCKVSEVELKASCEKLSYSYEEAVRYGYKYEKTIRDVSGYTHLLTHSDGRRLAASATDSFNSLHF